MKPAYTALLLIFGFVACREPATSSVDAAGDAAPLADARTMHGCNVNDPRSAAPEVFVGPVGYGPKFRSIIDGATTSIDLQMYLFTVTDLSTALINAKQRGVAVRVLLDPDHAGNTSTRSKLMSAGVNVQNAPAGFEYAHAKYMLVDGKMAVVSSGNFNIGALESERNYAFVTRDAEDLADLAAIFAADWDGTAISQACTRLLVSPYNSRPRLLAHINSAQTKLDLELFYMTDGDVVAAVKLAISRGVTVRAILTSPTDLAGNASTITMLKGLGVPVKVAKNFDLHAKLIIADGVAFIGSENMSYTSLTKNREVGALIFEPSQAQIAQAQFDLDFASEPDAP